MKARPAAIGFLITVTGTGDGGNVGPSCNAEPAFNQQCALRAAMEFANNNSGDDTIELNVPTTDPGYNPQTKTFTIDLPGALPSIGTGMGFTVPPSCAEFPDHPCAKAILIQAAVSNGFALPKPNSTGSGSPYDRS